MTEEGHTLTDARNWDPVVSAAITERLNQERKMRFDGVFKVAQQATPEDGN